MKLASPQKDPMPTLSEETPSTSFVSDTGTFEKRVSSNGQKGKGKDTSTDKRHAEEHKLDASNYETRVKKEFITPRKKKREDLDSNDTIDFRVWLEQYEDSPSRSKNMNTSQELTAIRRESPPQDKDASENKVLDSQAAESAVKDRGSSINREQSKRTNTSVEPEQRENQTRASESKSSSETNAAKSVTSVGSMDTAPKRTALETTDVNSTESLSTNIETFVQGVRKEQPAAESENQREENSQATNARAPNLKAAEVENGVTEEPCTASSTDEETSSDVLVVYEKELSEEAKRARWKEIYLKIDELLRKKPSPEILSDFQQFRDQLVEFEAGDALKKESCFESVDRELKRFDERVKNQPIIIDDSDDEPSSPSMNESTSTVVENMTATSQGTAVKAEASFVEKTNSSTRITPNNTDDLPARASSPASSSIQTKDEEETQQVPAQNEETSAASENGPTRMDTPVVLPVPLRSTKVTTPVVIPAIPFPKREPMDPESMEARSRREPIVIDR